jgi:hypothetical protein
VSATPFGAERHVCKIVEGATKLGSGQLVGACQRLFNVSCPSGSLDRDKCWNALIKLFVNVTRKISGIAGRYACTETATEPQE